MDATYYTPQEVARLLKLRVRTVYDYIREGKLAAARFGNRWRIAPADFDAFVEGQKAPSVSRGEVIEPTERPLIIDEGEGSDAERAERVIQMLDEWMADDSGYDEEAWPELEKALGIED